MVDILYVVSVLSAFQAAPREINLHQVFHIFAFIIKNSKATIYFDPRFYNIDPMSFSGSLAETFAEKYLYEME